MNLPNSSKQVVLYTLYVVKSWSAVYEYQDKYNVDITDFDNNTLNAVATGFFILSGDTDERYNKTPGLLDGKFTRIPCTHSYKIVSSQFFR